MSMFQVIETLRLSYLLVIYIIMFLQMFETLQARLAFAEEARKAAEQEKLEKEESGRVFLAEQEAIMEKIVQESKMLLQQADENSKVA